MLLNDLSPGGRNALSRFHLDLPLLLGLALLAAVGLVTLYSAGGQDGGLLWRQVVRLLVAFAVVAAMAQVPPQTLQGWSPWLFGLGLAMLLAVLVLGTVGKGAQRWLDFGLFRFQPSEIIKLAVPMMIAWYFADKPLPPRARPLIVSALLVLIPTLLIAKQPDLGTALLIASSGIFVLLFAGLRWYLVGLVTILMLPIAGLLWKFGMHDYQRLRVLTFLNPESDPLGSGYHIIQSKIAIGSGGVYGKGWLNGTQSHLEFLPERHTDFIFAVFGEEFGLMGAILLLILYSLVIFRGLYIAVQAQGTFSRLLAGGLTMTFMVYIFVNVGMVSGLLPVVGLPLPLISYGGSSMVTLAAAFGMLMSIHTHRRLVKS